MLYLYSLFVSIREICYSKITHRIIINDVSKNIYFQQQQQQQRPSYVCMHNKYISTHVLAIKEHRYSHTRISTPTRICTLVTTPQTHPRALTHTHIPLHLQIPTPHTPTSHTH